MEELNRKIAAVLTRAVGSMWMAYAFAILAFIGLPAALKPGGQGFVAWLAQTFLQLVLLSVIMVGQEVNSESLEVRDRKTHDAVMEQLTINRKQLDELKKIFSTLDDMSDSPNASNETS